MDIHCYEADENNCNSFRSNVNQWTGHKITLHEAALWSSSGEKLYFGGNGLSGSLVSGKENEKKVYVTTETIDAYGYENVGFIKMDIEGAEREAIKGAAQTIKRCRPILAICAYHLQDDLLVLPELIDSLECGYRMYLRHYMLSAGDTILYAVPGNE